MRVNELFPQTPGAYFFYVYSPEDRYDSHTTNSLQEVLIIGGDNSCTIDRVKNPIVKIEREAILIVSMVNPNSKVVVAGNSNAFVRFDMEYEIYPEYLEKYIGYLEKFRTVEGGTVYGGLNVEIPELNYYCIPKEFLKAKSINDVKEVEGVLVIPLDNWNNFAIVPAYRPNNTPNTTNNIFPEALVLYSLTDTSLGLTKTPLRGQPLSKGVGWLNEISKQERAQFLKMTAAHIEWAQNQEKNFSLNRSASHE